MPFEKRSDGWAESTLAGAKIVAAEALPGVVRHDVLVAKDLVEQKCVGIRWLPNPHQFADFLTKPERATALLEAFLRAGTVSLVPTT